MQEVLQPAFAWPEQTNYRHVVFFPFGPALKLAPPLFPKAVSNHWHLPAPGNPGHNARQSRIGFRHSLPRGSPNTPVGYNDRRCRWQPYYSRKEKLQTEGRLEWQVDGSHANGRPLSFRLVGDACRGSLNSGACYKKSQISQRLIIINPSKKLDVLHAHSYVSGLTF